MYHNIKQQHLQYTLELFNKIMNEEYDEKIQARAQQYREIPEDAGGLLRAFIRKEYELNRYKQ